LPGEIATFFIAALAMTVLTAVLGMVFAGRSLAPAEQMFRRLEQFTDDASHELRTPLAVVNSELDLALRTGEYEERIRAAKRELKQGAELVERLLELATLNTVQLHAKHLDLSDLVLHQISVFEPLAAERGLTVNAVIRPDVRARGDESLTAHLVANLLGNAVKFCGAGGEVSVSLTRSELRVSDTGPGIAAKDLPHIFERFYQADDSRSQEGHGLGLAISRNIAEVHGWRIRVESRPGRGATFTVALQG